MPHPLSRSLLSAARSAGSSTGSALRTAADQLELSARAGRFTREVSLTLAAVLLVGIGAASADPVQPASEPVAVTTAAAPPPAPAVPFRRSVTQALGGRAADLESPQPKPVPSARKPPPAAPAAAPPPPAMQRWLPTGTGMWLHEWNRSESGDARAVMARSKRSGFTHLYVQTGSTRKGWIGEEVLSELLPLTKSTPIKVIAWDFPKLIDPEADARRMARAATWSRPGTPTVYAVAPDIETAAEGTRLSAENVTRYYRELRRLLPKHIPILATVPWPSEKRTGSYPYAETAPWADAFIPMAYWYNRHPAVVTETSMTWLKRFGKPVMPVGQGYDGRIDVSWLKADPNLAKSVTTFIDTARRHGAQSVSLWSWQTTEGAPWTSLVKAAGTIGPKPAPKPAPKPKPVLPTGAEKEAADKQAAEKEAAEKEAAEKEAAKKKAAEKEAAKKKARDAAPGRKHDRTPKR